VRGRGWGSKDGVCGLVVVVYGMSKICVYLKQEAGTPLDVRMQ